VRVRLGLLLSQISATRQLTLELCDRATVEDVCQRVAMDRPEDGRGLSSAAAFVDAEQVGRAYALRDGDEVTLMLRRSEADRQREVYQRCGVAPIVCSNLARRGQS
jgi:molybdopterin converting factor small subunit